MTQPCLNTAADVRCASAEPDTHHLFVAVSTELLRAGHRVRFCAPGRSMLPTIRDGEEITVEPVAPRKVRRGDIVLYESRAGLIAHRVVKICVNDQGNRTFILRGDSSHHCDEAVGDSLVLGRVIAVTRKGRELRLSGRKFLLRTKLVRFASILAPRGK